MEAVVQKKDDVATEMRASDAYARVTADHAALKAEELIAVNIDIPAAVTTVLGVLPEVKALRDRMAKELPSFDVAAFDKLEDYALALNFAHAGYLSATQPADDLDALSADAAELKARLLADANALALHGLLDAQQFAQLRGGNGTKNLAVDLEVLSRVLLAAWPKIQGKSATSVEDLELAASMSTRLMRIAGVREQSPALTAAATDARLRAFTKLLHVYEDARSAVAFLRRREGDADTIAPSLYPGRPRRRPVDDKAPTDPASPPAAGAPGTPKPSADTTQPIHVITPAGPALSGLTAAKNAPASKDPFLTT